MHTHILLYTSYFWLIFPSYFRLIFPLILPPFLCLGHSTEFNILHTNQRYNRKSTLPSAIGSICIVLILSYFICLVYGLLLSSTALQSDNLVTGMYI